jgi:hypothetical protein
VDRLLLALAILAAGISLVIWATGGSVLMLGGLRVSATTGLNVRFAMWILAFAWLWRRRRPRVRIEERARPHAREILLVVVCAVVFVVGTLPLVWHGLQLWTRGDYVSQRYFWRSAPKGVDVAGLLVGNPFHPVWGALVQRIYTACRMNPIESVGWLGAAPLVLLFMTRRQWLASAEAKRWVLTGAVFLIWALGPRLSVFGADTGLILPQVLIRFVPVVANARIPGRAMVMVYLATAVLLAVAVASMQPARGRLLSLALSIAVLVDFCAIPLPLYPLDRPPIYERLAALPYGAVCELPFGVRDGSGEEGFLDHRTLYYQSIHRKPLVGGFAARLPDRVKQQYHEMPALGSLLRLSAGESSREGEVARDRSLALSVLRQQNIRYFILNKAIASDALIRYATTVLPLRLIMRDGRRELFVLDDQDERARSQAVIDAGSELSRPGEDASQRR